MQRIDYAAELLKQTKAFADLSTCGDLSTVVPTCPEWSRAHLIQHLGHGHRWAAEIVGKRLDGPPDWLTVPDATPADYEPDTLRAWLIDSARVLLNAFEKVGADARVWSMTEDWTATYWMRRRLHEATVHRYDNCIAAGVPYELSPELGADGADEMVQRVVAVAGGHTRTVIVQEGELMGRFGDVIDVPVPLEAGHALTVRTTDADLDLTAVRDGDKLTIAENHDGPVAVLTGPATELLLVLSRRLKVTKTKVELTGDPAVLDHWLANTPF
jgi:uncharacterized protein (TIGR03083 family)